MTGSTPGVIELAGWVSDLAPGGHAGEPAGYVDTAVPVDPTDDSSDTRLLRAGADPGAGDPTARATATFFDLRAMLELPDAR